MSYDYDYDKCDKKKDKKTMFKKDGITINIYNNNALSNEDEAIAGSKVFEDSDGNQVDSNGSQEAGNESQQNLGKKNENED